MSDSSIIKVKAREILDSRGNPTVEVDLHTGSGMARAAVPSGASTGSHEALEMRDGGKRYLGKGVLKAVGNVNKVIAPKVAGMDVTDQKGLDEMMIDLDATENKSRLGANAMLAVSMAACKAAAMCRGVPVYRYLADMTGNRKLILPVPMVLVLEGGKHAHDSSDIQEFMIAPYREKTFRETIRIGSEIYHTIGGMLKKKGESVNVGFEGAYGPSLKSTDAVLEVIMKGIEEAGYAPGKEIKISLDSAASEFFKDGAYHLDGKRFATDEMADWYAALVEKYPLLSLEDALAEDDWDGWAALTGKVGRKVMVIGDDLLVTNVKRIRKAIEMGACNSLLLKVNQIGTVSESIAAARLSFDNNWKVVISHRSGETCDPFIADAAVGMGTGYIKTGAPCRSERLSKYNQLLRIEEEMEGSG